MYKDLITMLERPPLYTKTTIPFWDDEHISKQMLKAHLDPNYEGASRKLQFIEKSVLWINEIVPASRYRQLIDIGCGPGIYAERFAQKGYRVTGVDFSRRSIDYAISSAKVKNVDISYLWQDYLKLKISKTFDLATMIYCDYGALSTTDRIAIMRTVFTHLRPGGRFLLDVFSMAKFKRFEETQTWELCIDGGFWYKEPHVVCDGHYKYPDNVTLEDVYKRQLVGVPAFLLCRSAIGNTGAMFVMLAVMLPAFFMAMYERDGQPFEKVVRNIVRARFLRPGPRPYQTANMYASFTGKEEPIEQKQAHGKTRPHKG